VPVNERGQTATVFPGPSDYVEAVQQRAFRAPELRRAQFALDPLFRIPMPASGSSAVVFRAQVDGVDQALRFLIREDASEKRRYTALGEHFAVKGLRDCVAATSWIDDAIQVKDGWWPMIKMEWIEGRTLDSYVGYLVEQRKADALVALAASWRTHVARLQAADFAHGDLQHGNVLVDMSCALRLVDFDGSWISGFEDWPAPPEQGNPNYQRMDRTWGPWMDTFPALVIYTGLLVLSRLPDAWRTLHDGENLLFTSEDFLRPGNTPTWRQLRAIADPEVTHAVQRLEACCGPRWQAAGTLEALLAREQVPEPRRSAGPAEPPSPFVLSDAPRPDWYVDEPPVVAPAPRPRRHGIPDTGPMPPPPPKPAAHIVADGSPMPPPPPKPAPHAAADTGPTFKGVQGAGAFSSSPSTSRTSPSQHPAPTRPWSVENAVPIAAVVAIVLAAILGTVVGGATGGAVAVFTLGIAFPLALAVLRKT
jgi:hypothetical protein